jgi:hypothetical protein
MPDFGLANINPKEDFDMNQINKRIHITASVIGTLLGMEGIVDHGLFEILQGYRSTNGFYIEAIGEEQRFWIHETEAAFTIIHNYLIKGILAVLVGLVTIIWCVKYIHTKRGTKVFFVTFVLLTIVGGGIGHIILFLPIWDSSTRIPIPSIMLSLYNSKQ